MNYCRLLFIFGLVVFATMSRLIPHPPNFTAINAVAVFCAFTLGHFGLSCCVVFGTMMFTDLILFGIHSQMVSVYFSLGIILFLNRLRINPLLALPLSSIIFFIVSNFGVWMVDSFYPRTFSGLGLCYFAALPFLANELISTCLYGFILFNCFAFFEKSFPALQKSC